MSFPESILTGTPRASVALVQVTLVALLGLLAWQAARRGGPALRGGILLATLVGLLLVPGLAAVAPAWLPLPECLCPASVEPAPTDSRGAHPMPLPLAGDTSVFALVVEPP